MKPLHKMLHPSTATQKKGLLGLSSPQDSLSEISHKPKMSIIDYAIILSSMYGIGAAIGIVGGAAKNILPNKKERPNLYAAAVFLSVFGAYRGYTTVTKFKTLEKELTQESDLEKALSSYIPKNILYQNKIV